MHTNMHALGEPRLFQSTRYDNFAQQGRLRNLPQEVDLDPPTPPQTLSESHSTPLYHQELDE